MNEKAFSVIEGITKHTCYVALISLLVACVCISYKIKVTKIDNNLHVTWKGSNNMRLAYDDNLLACAEALSTTEEQFRKLDLTIGAFERKIKADKAKTKR